MSIQAILRDVNLAPDEPLGKRRLPLEDLRPFLDPDQLIRTAGPVSLRIGGGVPQDLAIANPCAIAARLPRRVFFLRFQGAVNRAARIVHHLTAREPPAP